MTENGKNAARCEREGDQPTYYGDVSLLATSNWRAVSHSTDQ